MKPSRAAVLEAQRRTLINSSAIKRSRVAPQPQPNSLHPATEPAINSNSIVMKFVDETNRSHQEGKSDDSGSEDTKSEEEEKLGVEDV